LRVGPRGIEILGEVIRNATTSRDEASRPTLAFVELHLLADACSNKM